MRLRLWWHICVIDARAPEDHGFEPTIDIQRDRLRLPLNINDDQLCPSMSQLPLECDGWTDMSFFLISAEASMLLAPVIGCQAFKSVDVEADILAKTSLIEERVQALKRKFKCRPQSPNELCPIAFQHCKTAECKMGFILQLRKEINMQKRKISRFDSTDGPKKSFKIACDELQSYYDSTKGHLASRFGWFFATYTQWYALAYVLRCLCTHPNAADSERVWALVEAIFPRGLKHDDKTPDSNDSNGSSSIWGCLVLLRQQALLLKESHSLGNRTTRTKPRNLDHHDTSRVSSNSWNKQGIDTGLLRPAEGDDHIQDFRSTQVVGVSSEPNQNDFSTSEFSFPELPFLPDWNALINGCLDETDSSGIF